VSERTYQDLGEDPSLLLVDDDDPFLKRLAKAMEKRGFEVETAGSVAAGRAIATARSPAYAVVDLRLEDGNGLDVVEVLREKRPDCRVVLLLPEHGFVEFFRRDLPAEQVAEKISCFLNAA